MTNFHHHPASFRDPSGFVFQANGIFYRQVNQSYAADYKLLMSSGLYDSLLEKKLLIPHIEVDKNLTQSQDWYKTLQPQQLPFVSYPYEWSFDQLKDAALLTLKIMRIAVDQGMILKDATPFNIQFYDGKPLFIDTLSFEKYDPSQPWVAYRQFCESFLFPLYLEHYLKTDVQKILSLYLDGIPVDVTSRLLPMKSGFNIGIWLHVYLQNNIRSDSRTDSAKQATFNKKKLLHLAEHLESIITRFSAHGVANSVWSNYYNETILSQNYLEEKEKIFRQFVDGINFDTALDAGANEGYFSQILAEKKADIIAIDFDSRCINNLYRMVKKNKLSNILPLCIDITNPTPAVGFCNTERQSFAERVHVTLVTALALIHHLVLSKNIPLPNVAGLLHKLSQQYVIIEFVPLSDVKAKELIKNKKQFHTPYDVESFENYFGQYFITEKKQIIPGTERILYLMKKSNS